MNEIQIQRLKIRQLRNVIPLAEPHEKPGIRDLVKKHTIRLALLLLQKDLEKAIDGDFNTMASRKLDAVQILLEA